MQSLTKHNYSDTSDEIFESLLKKPGFLLERIITNGQTTPRGEWLCQARSEFVLMVKGSASLLFKENGGLVQLQPGDYIIIGQNKSHRVESVSQDEETIWLALHFDE